MARASVRGLCPPQERRPPQRKHDSIVVSDVRIVRKILTKIGTAAAANSRTPACLMLHCDATNKGPIRFVALHDPGFLKSRRSPFDPGRQSHYRIHVGARSLVHG